MAYTSRAYERKWSYEADENNFDARVGKILSGGLDLKASLRQKALDELDAAQAVEAEAERRAAAAAAVNLNAPTGPGTSRRAVDTRGHVWVDPQGRTLGPVGGGSSQPLVASSTSSSTGELRVSGRRPQMTERQAAALAMTTPERSMNLWKKLNPGCVEETIRTPKSTFKDHFGSKADQPDADKLDKTYHFQKTDFSEYTEVKLKLMNHLK